MNDDICEVLNGGFEHPQPPTGRGRKKNFAPCLIGETVLSTPNGAYCNSCRKDVDACERDAIRSGIEGVCREGEEGRAEVPLLGQGLQAEPPRSGPGEGCSIRTVDSSSA